MDGRDWTVLEVAELANVARERLGYLLAQIEQFETLLTDGANSVHPGSAFHGDDSAIAPHKVSALAWTPLAVAIDHLSLVGSVLRDLKQLNAIAIYTPLRPAIEAAAWSIWMLAPSRRDDRITRALQFMYLDEGLDGARLAVARGVTQRPTRSDLTDYFQTIVQNRPGIEPVAILKQVTTSEVLKLANAEVDRGAHDAVLWWTTLSALAHGRPHGLLSLLQREQVNINEDDGSRTLRLSASVAAITAATEVGVRYVNAASRLYATRNTGPNDVAPSDFTA